MKELNEINKKEETCCETAVPKTTVEDELHWARVRIEELINERNGLLDKLSREEKTKDALIDCLSKEHEQRVRAYEQTDWYCKRLDVYRSAINDIAEKCRDVLKDNNTSRTTVKRLAKAIFDITYRF